MKIFRFVVLLLFFIISLFVNVYLVYKVDAKHQLHDFISYQENPNEVTQNKLDSEWFPYKVKLLSLPVTNNELLTIKNAALALDDGDEEPGSFSCAEWSSKLLKYIIPELDIYTLPNSLWEAVVKEKEKRINLNGENK